MKDYLKMIALLLILIGTTGCYENSIRSLKAINIVNPLQERFEGLLDEYLVQYEDQHSDSDRWVCYNNYSRLIGSLLRDSTGNHLKNYVVFVDSVFQVGNEITTKLHSRNITFINRFSFPEHKNTNFVKLYEYIRSLKAGTVITTNLNVVGLTSLLHPIKGERLLIVRAFPSPDS